MEISITKPSGNESKFPCKGWSFKTNAILSIVLLACTSILFFSLFVWSMIPQKARTDSAEQKPRILCIYMDKDGKKDLQKQCEMIDEHCKTSKQCTSILLQTTLSADLMKYFWNTESFQSKTLFFVAVHGIATTDKNGNVVSYGVSHWEHEDLIKDMHFQLLLQ